MGDTLCKQISTLNRIKLSGVNIVLTDLHFIRFPKQNVRQIFIGLISIQQKNSYLFIA